MFDFPSSPTVGQTYPVPPVVGQPIYTWDGEKWSATLPSGGGISKTYVDDQDNLRVLKAGDTMSGALSLPAPTLDPHAANKAYVDARVTAVMPAIPGGRLTLQSNVPVMQLASGVGVYDADTVYWTPYNGAVVYFWSGTAWYPKIVNQVSALVTDATKNPGPLEAGRVHDWFLWDDAGVVRLCHNAPWGNNQTRSTVLLTMRNGILLNLNAITNACAGSRGVYVGTSYANANGKIDFSKYGGWAQARPAIIGLWNMYNRVASNATVREQQYTAEKATYTFRAVNSAQTRIDIVNGMGEDLFIASVESRLLASVSPNAMLLGIGIGTTSNATAVAYYCPYVGGAQLTVSTSLSARIAGMSSIYLLEGCENYTGGDSLIFVNGQMEFRVQCMA